MNRFKFKDALTSKQRGLAIVEFTIVLPLLLLLILATAEFGRALFQYNALTKGVRDGARYLSENAFIGSGAIKNQKAFDETKNLVMCGKTTCSTGEAVLPGIIVDFPSSDTNHVTVRAQYPYISMLGSELPTFGFGSGNIDLNLTLTASVTKRLL